MKLKYYLRGLGLGVIVTAVVLSFSGKTEELSDAEIKLRAVKLGMVEKSVLADIQNDKSDSTNVVKNDHTEEKNDFNNEDTTESTQNGEENSEQTAENMTADTQDEDNANIDLPNNKQVNSEQTEFTEPVEEKKKEVKNADIEKNKDVADVNAIDKKAEKVEKYVVISVNPGNGSELISRKLYDAGLIESAIMFNRFLVSNEYDKILRSGDHEIPVGATEEEMARILCGLE